MKRFELELLPSDIRSSLLGRGRTDVTLWAGQDIPIVYIFVIISTKKHIQSIVNFTAYFEKICCEIKRFLLYKLNVKSQRVDVNLII